MNAIRHILVAVKDPQARSQPAIVKAAQLAKAWRAQLQLFHVLVTPLVTDPYAIGMSVKEQQHALRRAAVGRLEVLATRLRRHGLTVTVSAEWDFPAHEAIVRAAQRTGARLIVAQCHAGRHRLPWLLRLTDWELVRLSAVPVLLVKNRLGYHHPAILAALDPSHSMDKPASLDRVILAAATATQKALRGRLHAMHAFNSYPIATVMPETINAVDIDVIAKQLESAAARRFKRTLRSTRLPPAQRHLVAGTPVDAIAATTRKTRSNIVVMGAISRSGLRNLLIGNTAEQILDDLASDILVVKPKAFRNRVARARRGPRFMVTSATLLD